MDETALTRSACQGDIEAFNQLVLTCQDAVFRQACWLLEDQVSAEAVTQEAFLLAYRNLNQFQGESFHLRMLRVVTCLCLENLRSPGHRTTIRLASFNPDSVGIDTSEGLIRSCLVDLPPMDRAILVLIDLQKLDYIQAAAVLEISAEEAARRLAHARQHVCRLIDPRQRYENERA